MIQVSSIRIEEFVKGLHKTLVNEALYLMTRSHHKNILVHMAGTANLDLSTSEIWTVADDVAIHKDKTDADIITYWDALIKVHARALKNPQGETAVIVNIKPPTDIQNALDIFFDMEINGLKPNPYLLETPLEQTCSAFIILLLNLASLGYVLNFWETKPYLIAEGIEKLKTTKNADYLLEVLTNKDNLYYGL